MLHNDKGGQGAAKGGTEVRSEGIDNNGYQPVMSSLSHIKPDTGDGNALDHDKSLV